jgi:hypothetical protein
VIVCDVPLHAPRPLPYHSPHFLQFADLPEPDADLSHPPYARRRPLKRARGDEDDAGIDVPAQKRAARDRRATHLRK